jgi:hypothetical protein
MQSQRNDIHASLRAICEVAVAGAARSIIKEP